MPITIRWPDPSHVLGPGYFINIHTDITGPIEVGSQFQFIVSRDNEGVDTIFTMVLHPQQHDAFFYVADPTLTDHNTLQSGAQQGDPVFAVMALIDPRGNITDSGTEQVTWSPTAQLWQHISQNPTAGGGLTQEQDAMLTAVHDAVLRAWQVTTGLLQSTPVGGIVSHPDINLLRLHNPPFQLRGRGFLTGMAPDNLNAIWGIHWTVTTAPAGAGLIDGWIRDYQYRVVQFAAEYFDAGSGLTMVSELVNSHESTFLWTWARYAPLRILYDVTEGFELTCHWLSLL